ncbi:MAG: hypothetical protein LJF04_01905 [Gemmatimonadetes bacterium]|nr:hypothetical protein [Gemmatimonadota bacterium]
MSDPAVSCPHCGSRLKKWRVPEGATWDAEHFWVCFDDGCPYYRDGWTWMMEQFGQKASYRYALNPSTGSCLPIPVWSDMATREMIEEDDEGHEP